MTVEGSGGTSRSGSEGSSADELPTVQESNRALPPVVDPPLPRYGRYQLQRRIGRGGMAEVFLAVMEGSQGFRRRCVVKRIRPEKARSAYYTQMFVDEARITAALHHPNIVQIYEFGEIGDLLFLTMEYLDGKNLGAVLDSLQMRERLMRPMLAAHIAQQIARGLHHAHTATDAEGHALGVIHRDMLTGEILLSESLARERNRRVMAGDAPAPSEIRPEVPAALDAVVLRCLQPTPEGRYPSAAVLADELGQAIGERRVDSA